MKITRRLLLTMTSIILSSMTIFAQSTKNAYEGDWIVINTFQKFEKDQNFNQISNTFFEINIEPKKIFLSQNMLGNSKSELEYKKKGDNLHIDKLVTISFEYQSEDTLNIIYNILSTNETNKYQTVRKSTYINNLIKDLPLSDTLIAKTNFTPQIIGTLFKKLDLKSIEWTSVKFSGYFVLDITNQKSSIELLEVSDSNKKVIKSILKFGKECYPNWETKYFNANKVVKVPFTAIYYYNNRVYEYDYQFFITDINKLNDSRNHINSEYSKHMQSMNYFEEGVKYYNKKKYDKAEESFVKAIMINPKNIDAMFNLSVIYLEKGDKEKACAILEELYKLQPEDVKDVYKLHCN